jgi:Beta-glucanase/Beta-glucan synthetase
MKAENAFAEEAKWKLTFEEDFDRAQLNNAKWITGYYWGKALLNDTYVLANEKQFFTPDNIEIRESVAHLVTRPQQCKGKVWDAKRGFIPQKFEYSSALISTGQSFRQQYGKFEAKIKVSHNQPLHHNFWMVAESIAPQIDIFKYGTANHKTMVAGTQFLKNKMPQQLTKAINGTNFSNDFYIYSLEWTPKKMVWRINGVEVHTQTTDIPDQSMYLVFSSNMTETPTKELRSEMAIDWVRCYQMNE